MHTALRTHVFPEDHHAGIRSQLDIERAANRRQHVDPRRLGLRGGTRSGKNVPVGRKTSLLLHFTRAVRGHLGKHVFRESLGIRLRASECGRNRCRDIVARLFGEPRPLAFADERRRHEVV